MRKHKHHASHTLHGHWSRAWSLMLVTFVFTTLVCANFATSASSFTHSPAATEYETPSVLDARALLSPDVRRGKHHAVLDEVVPFRFMHRFRITSPYGQFEAYGEDMLKIRIQEIEAIAEIEEGVNHVKVWPRGPACDHESLEFYDGPIQGTPGNPSRHTERHVAHGHTIRRNGVR